MCGLQGHGPRPPVVDDEPSSNEAGSEEGEMENTQEIEMWETINANLDKLEPLVDVDGMTRDERCGQHDVIVRDVGGKCA